MSFVVKGFKGMVWIRWDDDVYYLLSKEKCDLYIYIYIWENNLLGFVFYWKYIYIK